MKNALFASVLAMAGWGSSLYAYEREMADTAKQLAADFRRKNPGMDFRTTLSVAKFKAGNSRLENNGTSAFVRDLLQREFMRSVYFEVVERENLEKITSEIELKQKGLTQGNKSDDTLKSAEYILLGELNDDAQNLTVSARLVRVSSGEVVSAATTRIALQQAEKAADEFRYSTFQSQYGIALGVDGSVGPSSRSSGPPPALMSAFASYRIAKPLRLGAGISYFLAHEYIREEYPTGGGSMGGRNYNLSGVGGRFFADILLALHPRWNMGLRTDVHFIPGMKLEQDVSDVSTWEATGTSNTAAKRRVIVNGTSTWGMTIFKPALLFEYLISKRLSFFFSGGYAISTMFKPVVYEAGGYRQWDNDADKNGTFAQYQNFNFARRPDGSPVQFQLGYAFIDFGLSLHF